MPTELIETTSEHRSKFILFVVICVSTDLNFNAIGKWFTLCARIHIDKFLDSCKHSFSMFIVYFAEINIKKVNISIRVGVKSKQV